jgi:hypothetical protein
MNEAASTLEKLAEKVNQPLDLPTVPAFVMLRADMTTCMVVMTDSLCAMALP